MFDSLKFWKKNDDLPDISDHFNDEVDSNFDDKPFNPRTDFMQDNSPFGNGNNPGAGNSFGSTNSGTSNSFGSASNPSYGGLKESSGDNVSGKLLEKDMQILAGKLDAIKATIDSMNQRLEHIEKIAEKEDKEWKY